MRKIKFSFKGLSDVQAIQQCNSLKTTITDNPKFADSALTIDDFGKIISAAQAKLTDSDVKGAESKQATADKDAAVASMQAKARQLINYIEYVANGDEQVILSAGLGVRATRRPASIPDTVMNVSATAGDYAGRLDLQWDPVAGATYYEIQFCTDPMTEEGWKSGPSVTRSRAILTGLTSGSRVWVRVRAANTAGQGAWSGPATKIVP